MVAFKLRKTIPEIISNKKYPGFYLKFLNLDKLITTVCLKLLPERLASFLPDEDFVQVLKAFLTSMTGSLVKWLCMK